MTFIYINDRLLDLAPNTVIPLTLQSFDIAKLTSRFANRSGTFSVPKTDNNRDILGFADYVNSSSRVQYVSNKARIIQNGIEIVSNGVAIIKAVGNSYKINIYFGIFGLVDSIGNKELKDLTDAHADSAVIASPVMMSGVDVQYFFGMPTSDFPTIIESIISEAGFSYSGTVFTNNDYQRMALVYGRDSNELNENFAIEKEFKAINTGGSLSPGATYLRMGFADIVSVGALNMYSGGIWSTDNASPYAFNFTLYCDLNISVSGGSGSVEFSFLRDGVSVGTPLTVATGASANTLISYTATHAALTDYDYTLSYKHSSGSGSTVTVTEATFYVVVSRLWYAIATVGSSDIQNKYMLPDVKQVDLLKEFMQWFGLVAVENNKTVTFKSINEIMNDQSNAVDWTGKRVKNNDAPIEFSLSNYGMINNMTYSSFDENTKNEADHSVTIDNINLASEKNIIESIFSDSLMEYRTFSIGVDVNMALIPNYTGSDIKGAGLRAVMIRDPYAFEGTAGKKVAYFIEPREPYQMSWEYFYENYYSDLFTRLQDIKVVQHEYTLTDADIASFDPSLLIYDSGNYYSFPVIKNYISGKITKVQMLKV